MHLAIIFPLLLITRASAQDAASSSKPPPPASGGGAYDYPPPPAGGGAGFPGLGGFGGFPFFPGFYKNFDLNYGAGFGPFGGLGGLLGGGVPPGGLDPGPIDEAGIPPPFGGFGGFGPSYIPSTWIGSALGAKGDLLFPVVIFIFFVVGVWTVIQFLLAFIVPLIAKKLAIKGAVANALFRRDVNNTQHDTTDLDFITNAVLDAINEPKCMKYVACHSGMFLNGMVGSGKGMTEYEGMLKALSNMAKSEALDIFEEALLHGKSDCGQYTCSKVEQLNNNSTTNHNEI